MGGEAESGAQAPARHTWHHQLGRKRLLLLLHPLRHMGEAPNGRIRTSSRIWSSRYDALSSSTCGACCNLQGRSRISCSSTCRDIRAPPVVTSSGPCAVTYSLQPQVAPAVTYMGAAPIAPAPFLRSRQGRKFTCRDLHE